MGCEFFCQVSPKKEKKERNTNPLVKYDLRREGGKKNKKNRALEHMRSCTTPGNA